MQITLTLGAILLYSLSLILLLQQLKNRKLESTPLFKVFFYLSVILHILTLNYSVFPNQALQLGFFSVSSLIFCVISITSCLSIIRKLPIESLLLMLIPCATLSIIVAQWPPTSDDKIITDSGLISHIVLSILAYSIITIAALQALALAAQESILRKHSFNTVFQFLPPLQTMEKLLFEMIWLGFALLSLSITSGFIFLDDMFAQHVAHKTILSIIAWVIFGTLLYGRIAKGWRGITATKWTISGFIALMLAYFGSKFVLEIILQRI
jgi:ABC-type uncharacterized transport system permease subunit